MSDHEANVFDESASLVTDEVPTVDTGGSDVAVEPTIDAAPSGPAPVEPKSRLGSVDTLRGVALLGILAMNIAAFAWPDEVYSTPTAAPGSSWADLALWMVNHVVFDTKMMTIFSMLFGAGLVLMADRASERGASIGRVYYRRIGILLLIGCVHAYFIWYGDILVFYALCGFLLYPFRNKSPRTLLVLGVVLIAMAFPALGLIRAGFSFLRETSAQVESEVKAGSTPKGWRKSLHEVWKKMEADRVDAPSKFRRKIEIYRGGYAGIVADRANNLVQEHTFGFVFFGWWAIGGRMLLGMGLMKLGVFSALRSRAFYQRLALVSYGIGLPLVLADIAIDWKYEFFVNDGLAYVTGGWWLVNWVSSPFMALGHVAVVMLLVQTGVAEGLTRRLAAVGRMALTNYLFDSIACTTLFYGYGLGLYGRLLRPEMMLVVVTIWGVQLWFSPIWLRHFRYGPAEWAWRSLTYGEAQPFRREVDAA